jgi:hypothetical protein
MLPRPLEHLRCYLGSTSLRLHFSLSKREGLGGLEVSYALVCMSRYLRLVVPMRRISHACTPLLFVITFNWGNNSVRRHHSSIPVGFAGFDLSGFTLMDNANDTLLGFDSHGFWI